ncbi:MAG: cell division protein FtsL [Armatimonadota bacterium]|nr:cell division protein FtsL [Armatimonadota bacterium]
MIAIGSRTQVYPVLLPGAREETHYRTRRAKRRPEIRFLILLAILLLPALFYVSGHVEMARTGYQISRLREEVALLQRENERLRAKVASLSDPERIAWIATNQLGMIFPAANQVAVVEVPVPLASQAKPVAVRAPTWWEQVQAWFLHPEAQASEP